MHVISDSSNCKIPIEENISKFSIYGEKLSNRYFNSALCTQVGVSLAVSMMQVLGGIIMGYTGIILPQLTDQDSEDIYLNPQQLPFFTSILRIGAFTGTFFCGFFTIRYGQRVTMLMFMPLGITGWLISYFSKTFWQLLLSRLILGIFAIFCFGCSAPFIAETVHSSLRGRLMSFCDLSRQIGLLFVFSVGSSNLDWRTVGLVCGLTPLVIPFLVLLVVPNSPRWTAVKGRPKEEVVKCLTYFRGDSYDIEEEYKEIQEDIQEMKNSSNTLSQLRSFKEKSIVKRLLLLIYINVAFAFSGGNIVVTYCSFIFKSAKTSLSVNLSTILIAVIRTVSILIYMCIADRFGRKPIFLIFASLSSICIGSLGVFFYLKEVGYDTTQIFWVPLTSLLCFTFFTSMYTPAFELLRSELLPNSVRGLGYNIILFFLNVAFFLGVLTYPIIADSIGSYWAFLIYSVNTLTMVVVLHFFLPETKGKTLEEIAKFF